MLGCGEEGGGWCGGGLVSRKGTREGLRLKAMGSHGKVWQKSGQVRLYAPTVHRWQLQRGQKGQFGTRILVSLGM